MVTEVVMTVWIRLVQGSEKVKDQDVDEAHGKSEGVYSKGGVLHVEKNGEEVGGLDMVTTDEDPVLRGDRVKAGKTPLSGGR